MTYFGFSTNKLSIIQDEPLSYHADKMMRVVKDYRHEFEDTHCRVHWCHKSTGKTGAGCPICPVIDVAETACGDILDLTHKLKKKYKINITRKTKKNGTWTWIISQND